MLLYIPTFFLVSSLISVLICILPRTSHRMTGEKIIHLYGQMEFEKAAGTLALNYASLEKELNNVYAVKFKYLQFGLIATIVAVCVGVIILAYLIFDP